MLILGIETSCDETAAAVVRDGEEILSSIVSSQVEVHREYGGVVPELASRQHIQNICPVVEAALGEAGVTLPQIDAFSATYGPGLIGSLLVGLSYAKALAYALERPMVAINHVEAHIHAVFLENRDIEFPALALVVSGGHTSLFYLPAQLSYQLLGSTRDDAAGEAYDKVAKLLKLGYPGGPVIDRLSPRGNPKAVVLPVAKISDGSLDFSFSGLKTAVLRWVERSNLLEEEDSETKQQQIYDLIASFQRTLIKSLMGKITKALRLHPAKSLLVGGGVACNQALRKEFHSRCQKMGLKVYFPSLELSTDNAAMVASLAYYKLNQGEAAPLDLDADASLRLA